MERSISIPPIVIQIILSAMQAGLILDSVELRILAEAEKQRANFFQHHTETRRDLIAQSGR